MDVEVEDVETIVVDKELKSCSGAGDWKVSLLGILQSNAPDP